MKAETRDEANELLNEVVSYARRMLKRYGEFGPFAFSMKQDGSLSMEEGFHDGPPDPALMLDLLIKGMTEKASRGRIRAGASAANITLKQPSEEGYPDGVRIEIEHQDGYCVEAFVPYRMTGGQWRGVVPRRILFGRIQALVARSKLFANIQSRADAGSL